MGQSKVGGWWIVLGVVVALVGLFVIHNSAGLIGFGITILGAGLFLMGVPTPSIARDCANQSESQLEALKYLGDWTKWLISLETALLGLSIFFSPQAVSADSWLKWAVICFISSIIASGFLLGSIPAAIECRPIKSGTNIVSIYEYKQFGAIKIVVFAGLEHSLFLIGLGLFMMHFWFGAATGVGGEADPSLSRVTP
jgi:hypothetical protein